MRKFWRGRLPSLRGAADERKNTSLLKAGNRTMRALALAMLSSSLSTWIENTSLLLMLLYTLVSLFLTLGGVFKQKNKQ